MTAPALRRTQTDRRDEAHRRLLEAGVRLVAEHGFEGLSLAEVGIAAGYSRGLPAHHFGSKRQFEIELVSYLQQQFRAEMDAYRNRTDLTDLVALVRWLFESAESDPNRLCAMRIFLSPAGMDAELTKGLVECRNETAELLEYLISEGVKKGEIRANVDPHLTGLTLMLAINGYLQLWLQDKSLNLNKVSEEFTALIKDGLTG